MLNIVSCGCSAAEGDKVTDDDFWGRRRQLKSLQEEYVEVGGAFLENPSSESRARMVLAMDAMLQFYANGKLGESRQEDPAPASMTEVPGVAGHLAEARSHGEL